MTAKEKMSKPYHADNVRIEKKNKDVVFCEKDKEKTIDNSDKAIEIAQNECMEFLSKAFLSITELAKLREKAKMSNSRVNGIAREVRELMKVMATYLN